MLKIHFCHFITYLFQYCYSTTQKFLDKHPEKRLKAAYTAFEADNLPRLRAENPSMRLSQVKQLMNKEWMKSPDNPINQRYMNNN